LLYRKSFDGKEQLLIRDYVAEAPPIFGDWHSSPELAKLTPTEAGGRAGGLLFLVPQKTGERKVTFDVSAPFLGVRFSLSVTVEVDGTISNPFYQPGIALYLKGFWYIRVAAWHICVFPRPGTPRANTVAEVRFNITKNKDFAGQKKLSLPEYTEKALQLHNSDLQSFFSLATEARQLDSERSRAKKIIPTRTLNRFQSAVPRLVDGTEAWDKNLSAPLKETVEDFLALTTPAKQQPLSI
jgi:hypothetical protein